MDLKNIVAEKTAEMVENGTIEKMITASLEETIAGCIENSMRKYSDFGKAIEAKISEAVQCGAKDIELPEYNQFIKQVIEEKFIQVLKKESVGHLSDLIDKVIVPVESQTKTSLLIAQIEELWGSKARDSGREYIEIDVDTNDEETAMYVTIKDPEYDMYNVKVTFYNFRHNNEDLWHIGYINESDVMVTGRAIRKACICTHEVTDLLYKYYAMGTKFELDSEFENICVSGY